MPVATAELPVISLEPLAAQVLELTSTGHNKQSIADELQIRRGDVSDFNREIMEVFSAASIEQAIAKALMVEIVTYKLADTKPRYRPSTYQRRLLSYVALGGDLYELDKKHETMSGRSLLGQYDKAVTAIGGRTRAHGVRLTHEYALTEI